MTTQAHEEWSFSDSQIEGYIGRSLISNAIPVREEDVLSDLELALAARQERLVVPVNTNLPINSQIQELGDLLRQGGAFSTLLFGEPVTITRHARITEVDIQGNTDNPSIRKDD